MVPTIKILSVNGKWANILYSSSNARSRQKIENIKEDYNKGIINVVNPANLDLD
ncbi:MAG: hypothetical protein HKO66_16135 [Saprospiraceae bacterium]|nr:hypothetical protein [Bacteroidia bacterium]NNE16554.1 hypothetical protein [Saprospiraceae bacterium]NNL93773.1 hypothetical protein [Saprospiraceae bacterium]